MLCFESPKDKPKHKLYDTFIDSAGTGTDLTLSTSWYFLLKQEETGLRHYKLGFIDQRTRNKKMKTQNTTIRTNLSI
jgi:hypothetical protein